MHGSMETEDMYSLLTRADNFMRRTLSVGNAAAVTLDAYAGQRFAHTTANPK